MVAGCEPGWGQLCAYAWVPEVLPVTRGAVNDSVSDAVTCNRSGPVSARLSAGSGAFGGRERRPDGSVARRRAEQGLCHGVLAIFIRFIGDFLDDIHGEMGRMMGPMMGRVTFVSEAVSSEEGVTAGAGVTPCGGTLQVSSRMHAKSRRSWARSGFTWCVRPACECVHAACVCV